MTRNDGVIKLAKRFAQYSLSRYRSVKRTLIDGAVAGINVSESLTEELLKKAPAVSKKVKETLLTKWLKQRGVTNVKLTILPTKRCVWRLGTGKRDLR